MWPPTHVGAKNDWQQRNVRLATKGCWTLHVCLANKAAAKRLNDKAAKKDFSGFSSLPEGMVEIGHVAVERK
jgi:hypothetical protein